MHPFTSALRSLGLFLVLASALAGCSREAAQTKHLESIRPSPALPFKVQVVQTEEARDREMLFHQAASCFQAKDYDKLESLAAACRASKAACADGTWRLAVVYLGIGSAGLSNEVAWAARETDLKAWVKARPGSATARIALARFFESCAWKARGSGAAKTVSEKGWQVFRERLGQAAEVLEKGKDDQAVCPVWASTFLSVALALQVGRSQYDALFQDAVHTHPDYWRYYQLRAVFLLPRWTGRPGEWETDLARSADRLGGEPGDELYAQVAWSIHHYGPSRNLFEENQLLIWKRVDQGFAVILKQFPHSLAAKNERALLAVLAGDKPKARAYFAQTEGQVDLSVWKAEAEYLEFANWAYQ